MIIMIFFTTWALNVNPIDVVIIVVMIVIFIITVITITVLILYYLIFSYFILGFDLQFVLSSINALGEDEESQETFLHSLNPARKNSLVKCNLQYVLTLLRSLGRVDNESAKNAGSSKSKKCNTAEPKNGVDQMSLSSKNNDNNMSDKDDDVSDDNWRTSISQSAVSFGNNAQNASSNHDTLTHSKSFQSDSKSCNDIDNNSNYYYTSSCKERSVKG